MVQRRVLDVLALQVIDTSASSNSTTAIELRRMGLETLHQILQSSGHTLVVGWETIFDMPGSVCKTPLPPSRSVTTVDSPSLQDLCRSLSPLRPLDYVNEKRHTPFIKTAFQSLSLVCGSLSSFSSEHFRLAYVSVPLASYSVMPGPT